MKNTNRRFWAALILFSLTGQIAWVVENMYFNVFIYKMFGASAADIALMVQASAVAAASPRFSCPRSAKLTPRSRFSSGMRRGAFFFWRFSDLPLFLRARRSAARAVKAAMPAP